MRWQSFLVGRKTMVRHGKERKSNAARIASRSPSRCDRIRTNSWSSRLATAVDWSRKMRTGFFSDTVANSRTYQNKEKCENDRIEMVSSHKTRHVKRRKDFDFIGIQRVKKSPFQSLLLRKAESAGEIHNDGRFPLLVR